MTWVYKGKIFEESDIEDYYGFVYCITNLVNNKKYIGKKFFYSSLIKKVKGKRKRYKSQSNWQTYYGSNEDLQKHVIMYGKDNFKREILYLCTTKGQCGYLEAKEQFDRNVLVSEEYYNSWIMVRVRKTHLKGLDEKILTENI